MIRISQQEHNDMMAKTFTDDELNNVLPFVDNQITGIATNLAMWKKLIEMFVKIPKGRLSRIYIYQIMALNGIVDEERYNKLHCSCRAFCPTLEDNKDISPDLVCNNLSKCLILPYFHVYPPFLPTNKKFVEIDDTILKM